MFELHTHTSISPPAKSKANQSRIIRMEVLRINKNSLLCLLRFVHILQTAQLFAVWLQLKSQNLGRSRASPKSKRIPQTPQNDSKALNRVCVVLCNYELAAITITRWLFFLNLTIDKPNSLYITQNLATSISSYVREFHMMHH